MAQASSLCSHRRDAGATPLPPQRVPPPSRRLRPTAPSSYTTAVQPVLDSVSRMTSEQSSHPELLVLLSGGLDSTAVLHFYKSLGRPVMAMFVEYGQAAAEQERRASRAICEHFSVLLVELDRAAGLTDGGGMGVWPCFAYNIS